jgi:predicted TIM-barrel fold metal-dependent hydrolase
MLDLTSISVVDNHCHPLYLDQRLDVPRLRRLFTEASDTDFANKHVPHSVHYLWAVRQMVRFYGCSASEQEIVEAHNGRQPDALLADLVKAANIDTLVIDTGYPPPDQSYTPEQMGQAGGCKTAKLLRLETLMQDLIVAHSDFDEVIDRLAIEVRRAHEHGYSGLKSIVAYRTGLNIAQWSKDEAVAAFVDVQAEAASKGQIRIQHKVLLDYLLHIAFQQAAEQQLPVQFHTGYGDSDTDLRLGNPLQLRDVLEQREYRTMPVVLLHESYPYCQLGAYLAAVYPQVYFDLSYTIPFVDKLEMLAFTRQAVSVAPASKLLYSTDGIYIAEMHWMGALRARDVMGQVLQEMVDADEIDGEQAYQLARWILHDTAYELYRL